MNIIAGTHRGRQLASLPDNKIRPTSSRSREALFNILTHQHKTDGSALMQDSYFADICCGSGAIGLEALSRGASHTTFVDNNSASLGIAKQNAVALKLYDACAFVQSNVRDLAVAPRPYDIIFTDPPYDSDILPDLMQQLSRKQWVNEHSVLITEQHCKAAVIETPHFDMYNERKYGNAILRFYRYNN